MPSQNFTLPGTVSYVDRDKRGILLIPLSKSDWLVDFVDHPKMIPQLRVVTNDPPDDYGRINATHELNMNALSLSDDHSDYVVHWRLSESAFQLEIHEGRYGHWDATMAEYQITIVQALYLSHLKRITLARRRLALSSADLWQHLDRHHQCQYVAYAAYCDQGWIVKSGENYGATFVLYPDVPSRCHSTYLVQVVETNVYGPALQAWARLAIDVKKTLVLAQVKSIMNEEAREIWKYSHVEMNRIVLEDVCIHARPGV